MESNKVITKILIQAIYLLNYYFFKIENLFSSEIINKHAEWKSIRWQKVNIREANEEAEKQMQALNGLPSESYSWDVYLHTKQEIINIKVNNYFIFCCFFKWNNKIII
jgi:hypothetical protein